MPGRCPETKIPECKVRGAGRKKKKKNHSGRRMAKRIDIGLNSGFFFLLFWWEDNL